LTDGCAAAGAATTAKNVATTAQAAPTKSEATARPIRTFVHLTTMEPLNPTVLAIFCLPEFAEMTEPPAQSAGTNQTSRRKRREMAPDQREDLPCPFTSDRTFAAFGSTPSDTERMPTIEAANESARAR
jgi:hypothetical protein